MSNKKSAATAAKQASEVNVFEAAGIDLSDLDLPFIKVTSAWQRVTICTVRKPEKAEAWKKLDDRDPFPVYAIMECVDGDGQDATWDITSKRLRNDLAALVGHKVPADIEVRKTGKPPRTVYQVRRYTTRLDVDQGADPAPECDKEGCFLAPDHKGAHLYRKGEQPVPRLGAKA